MEPWNHFFNYPRATTFGLYAASLYLPTVFTAYIGDSISQRYGRKMALYGGSFLVTAGGFINTFAINAAMWVAGEFSGPLFFVE